MNPELRRQFLKTVKLQYDAELPIVQRREEISALIRDNQVVVVCGETGSGKSTQLPKFCLELGRGITGTIGHTQPRRIAARSIANRIAEELDVPLGQAVGYKVRFEEKISADSLVKLMTDGILLSESQSDRRFKQYDTIIIDEAHERSLNIDFLLGMMKQVLPQRPDLKLIITSATIDAKRFAEHFSDRRINHGKRVPVIEVSGRTYPINVVYRSVEDYDDEEESDSGQTVSRGTTPEERAILAAIDELAEFSRQDGLGPGRGDILIFLPTERDIFETAKLLRHSSIPGDDKVRKTDILPLYARLPVDQQQKVFKTSSHRRIVLATNVAESSLTVPGIRYVIDTGTARISRYSPRSRTQRLPIEPVSQASADQRAGRCGRVGPGVCIRLFSEQDYRGRDRYTTPEIQRTNLASVILQTLALKLGNIEHFPFLDPPKVSSISDGYKTLYEIGAIDSTNRLTEIGWKLSRLPVDPRIGRMILAAEENGVLREMLVVASVLEIQDPRERPQEHQGKADMAHARFLDDQSDFVGFLRLWDFYQNLKDQTSRSRLRKACQQNFLSFNRLKEWNDIHVQLQQFVHEAKMKIGPRKDDFDALHRSILTGMLSGIAQRDERFEYSVCGGGKFFLWPGSGLQKKRIPKEADREAEKGPAENQEKKGLPRWIVSMERVETTRKYLRTVARIDSDWIESLAGHLVNKVYFSPHWNADTGYVHAYEKVSLLGIVIVPKRRINFGPIDPKAARDIFIQQALVEDDLHTKLDFLEYNRALLDEAKKLGDKLRRPEIVRGELARHEFYQARIPGDVFDQRSLEKFYKGLPKSQTNPGGRLSPKVAAALEKQADLETSGVARCQEDFLMELVDLCTEQIDKLTLEKFPDKLKTFDGSSAKLEYRFAPGEEHDGLTVVVPVEGLRQLEPARIGWLVPGLVEQKISAMLKSLPKEIRRQIVPVPETARELIKKIEFGSGSLDEQVAREVSRLVGRLVVPADFNVDQLPPELRMNIKVLDHEGKAVGEGRNLDELRKEFGIKESLTVSDPRWNRTGLTEWNFGNLPESIELNRGGVRLKAFPMLQIHRAGDGGSRSDESCDLALADSLDKAVRETRLGMVRLFYLAAKRDIKTQVQWLPNADRLKVYAQPLPEFDYHRDIGRLVAARSLQVDELPIARNPIEFELRVKKGKERLGTAVQEITKWIGSLLESFHQARLAIEQNKSQRTDWAWRDAKEQLRRLVEPGFMLQTPWTVLKEFPRFFKAIPLRFEKLRSGGETSDRQGTDELDRFWTQYQERLDLHQAAGITDPELETFRWMLEEYRVSIFAQRLGTVTKVSPQRLDKQFEKVRR